MTNWLSGLVGRIQPTAHRPRPRRRSGWAGPVAAEIQLLEARALLSGVLTDTTPKTTVNATAGTSTGQIVLATFSDAIPAEGLTSTYAVPGAATTRVGGFSGSNIAGIYSDASGRDHGFFYDGSTLTTFDPPPGYTTIQVAGVSGKNVAGAYQDAAFNYHGFLYDGSTFTTVDPPGAAQTVVSPVSGLKAGQTFVSAVSGVNVVGYYQDAGGQHGFLHNASTGVYTSFDPPGSVYSYVTGVSGDNVVGVYLTSDRDGYHSFLYNGSTLSNIDVPGGHDTTVTGISGNNIVGTYQTIGDSSQVEGRTLTSNISHGFLFNGSTFTTIDVPGATYTQIRGISGGTIFGSYNSSAAGDMFRLVNDFRYDGSTFTTTGTRQVRGPFVAGSPAPSYGSWYEYPPVQADFTPTVDWGGALIGSPTVSVELVSQSASGSTWAVVGNATYAQKGNYTIAVTVSDANDNSVQTSNTTIAVAAAQDVSAVAPSVPAVIQNGASIYNAEPLASFYVPSGSANNSPAPAKTITPVILLALDAAPADASATWQNDNGDWSSLDRAALMFSDSLDSR